MRKLFFFFVFISIVVACCVAGHFLSKLFLDWYNSGGGISLNSDIFTIKAGFVFFSGLLGMVLGALFVARLERKYF